MTAALRLLASPAVTWISLAIILGLGLLGAGIVVGQWLERERPACGWSR